MSNEHTSNDEQPLLKAEDWSHIPAEDRAHWGKGRRSDPNPVFQGSFFDALPSARRNDEDNPTQPEPSADPNVASAPSGDVHGTTSHSPLDRSLGDSTSRTAGQSPR